MEMKNFLKVVVCSLAFIASVGPASAATTTINFDDVSSPTTIDNYYSAFGVAFSTAGSRSDDSHAYAMGSTYNTSVPNIIGCNLSSSWLNASCYGIATFTSPTDYVEIYAISDKQYTTSWAWIKAYDSTGAILDTVQTANFTGTSELLFINRPTQEIAYLEFMGKSSRHVNFDDISFNVAPEPVSAALFVAGGVIMILRCRLKRKSG
jgi:hypothetical protein